MNKKRLFASIRNNGSAQSGLARVSGAFVVLIGIVLLVMSGCAGDVTVQVPTQPKGPIKLPKLNIHLEISASTVTQGGDVTLSATVTNTGEGPSLENALLVFYRSEDAVITPDIISNGLVHNIELSAELAIEDAMHSGFGLDPMLFANSVKRSLAADQNVQEAIDERASQNAQEGIIGIVLDPVIDSTNVAPLAINQTSEKQTIAIPSTADVGSLYYGACVVLVSFDCASEALAVTIAPVPDLVPASPAAPVFDKLRYITSEMVTVSGKVRNAGGGDSTDGVVRLFREAGDTDVPIGEPIALGTIAADATADFSTTFITAGTVTGVQQQEYYFVIGAVSNEATSSNNASGTGIIIISDGNLVDGDNDNLIDIYNLNMLNNIRYNLAGTSYKTSAADLGKSCGSAGTTACIGYELMRDLDFNKSSSYENNQGKIEWLPNNHNPADSTNAGWEPLGTDDGAAIIRYITFDTTVKPEKTFSAIFEGNEHSISDLYSRRVHNSGLFNVVTGTVRNLTVFNGNVYAESGDGNKVGVVAAVVYDGAVLNCAARGGSANGGSGDDAVGGLVGVQIGGRVAASYATTAVYSNGGGYAYGGYGYESTGGLVGANYSGAIIASYAAGAVRGGATGRSNALGGLVGRTRPSQSVARAAIIASYTTANSYGEVSNEAIGGIVGHSSATSITASYTTGNVATGPQYADFVASFANGNHTTISVNNSYSFSGYKVGSSSPANTPIWKMRRHRTSSWSNMWDGNFKPNGVIRAGDLTASNAGSTWNNANNWTAGAWVFDANYGAPALKYADYDGGGGFDYCAHFPAGACSSNRLLPNQPVVDQGSSIQTAYVIDTQLYLGIGVSIPAKLTLGDSDYFQITVKQAGLLTIESDSNINDQGALYTNRGALLEHNDNGGEGNSFKISRAIARGVYYIRAYGYSNQAGLYTLDVSLTECVAGATCAEVEVPYTGPVANLTACPVIDGHALSTPITLPGSVPSQLPRTVFFCTYSPTVVCPDFQGWKVDSQTYWAGLGRENDKGQVIVTLWNEVMLTNCTYRKRK